MRSRQCACVMWSGIAQTMRGLGSCSRARWIAEERRGRSGNMWTSEVLAMLRIAAASLAVIHLTPPKLVLLLSLAVRHFLDRTGG